MRDRFDQTNKEKDMRKLVAMVEEGEEELWRNQYFQPFYFKVNESIGIRDRIFRNYSESCQTMSFIYIFRIPERSRWYFVPT